MVNVRPVAYGRREIRADCGSNKVKTVAPP
jgi:hypothetical protein